MTTATLAPPVGIRHVRQADAYGCGVACLAMVTGHPYDVVRDWFRCQAWQNAQHDGRTLEGDAREAWEAVDFSRRGLVDWDIHAYLSEHGFVYAHRSAILWQRGPNHHRAVWPPAPFADAHIVQALLPIGGHYVVWLPDGRVYDPAGGSCTTLAAFADIGYVIGVCRMGGL